MFRVLIDLSPCQDAKREAENYLLKEAELMRWKGKVLELDLEEATKEATKYKEIVVELNEKLREGRYESLPPTYVAFSTASACSGDHPYFGLFPETSSQGNQKILKSWKRITTKSASCRRCSIQLSFLLRLICVRGEIVNIHVCRNLLSGPGNGVETVCGSVQRVREARFKI